MLLVLDNLEHLVAEGTGLVGGRLAAAPHTPLLVTSRVPLGLATEQVWPLSPLSPEEGAALFVERAQRVRPESADRKRGASGGDGHRRGAGGPAAKGDRAGRIAHGGALARAAAQAPAKAARGADDGPRAGRHGSMRRTVLDSVRGRSAEERAAFVACACFRNGFTLEAAEAVVGGGNVLAVVEVLTRSSLVRTRAVPALGG